MWWWMFLWPHEEPLEGTDPVLDANSHQARPVGSPLPVLQSATSLPSIPALAQRVRTITGLSRKQLEQKSLEPFWQGQRNNCLAIALLTSLQKTRPGDYLKLLRQLYDNGELRFRSNGNDTKVPANLTGDFNRVSADGKPHELLAATLMQAIQSALTAMMRDDLAEFAQKNGIPLSTNFHETFHPELQWRQDPGMFIVGKETVDGQLRALRLNTDQINDFYDFMRKKYIEIHGGQRVNTFQCVRTGAPLVDGTLLPVANENCLVFNGTFVGRAYKILFGQQASQPVAVIDGKKLCKHARQSDYDYAPRKLLRTLLKMKQEYRLAGDTVVPAESVQYHAFTFQIPKFDTMKEIEDHLSRGGHIVVGSTNWGPDMLLIISRDNSGKMCMYYGDQKGVPSANHAMGRCFLYSSNERDVRIYDPTKLKFDTVDS
jgi:hypothetical protein